MRYAHCHRHTIPWGADTEQGVRTCIAHPVKATRKQGDIERNGRMGRDRRAEELGQILQSYNPNLLCHVFGSLKGAEAWVHPGILHTSTAAL